MPNNCGTTSTSTMDDPRFKLGGIASELISQLTASLSDHVGWLEDHLEQAAAGAKRRRTTTTTREHASVGGTAAHPARWACRIVLLVR